MLLLLLIFVGFSVPPPPEIEEGILVNFGTDETGSGMIEPSPPVTEEELPPPLPANAAENQAEDPLLTQDFEEAPEVLKADPEAEKRKLEEIEADRILKEQIEAERIRREQEEAERRRLEADRVRQAEIIDRTQKALVSSKNANTDAAGEGVTGGAGNQGVTSGSVDSNIRGDGSGLGDQGIKYDLEGRRVQTLPKPEYDYQKGGIVVVNVSVDRSGKVIQAVPGTRGSTTLDENLLKVAKEAAMKARFEAKPDAPEKQQGTITYNFILK